MRTVLVLVVLVALSVAIRPAVQAQSAADEAAIRQTTEQLVAAWNAKDLQAYLTFFDEDCRYWSGGPCNAASKESGEIPEGRDKVYEELDIQFITSDVAIHKYREEYSGYLDADGQSLPPGRTLFSRVYVRKGGKWLQAAQHSRAIEE